MNGGNDKKPKFTVSQEILKLFEDRKKDRRQVGSKRKRMVENRPPQFGQILNTFFKANTQALKKIEETRAILAWESIVGDTASRASQPLRVRGGKLVVKVEDPLWMQQLLLLKTEILKKYRQRFPQLHLTDIFFSRTD
jgi:predicted nucleic acid-binding Zn ribbon protein